MAKSQDKTTPGGDDIAVSQIQTTDMILAEQDPPHGSHVVNGPSHQGSTSRTRYVGDHPGRAAHGISIHSVCATQVDGTSWVYNGNVTNGQDPSGVRVHRMDGGSVANGSKIFNGNMTADEFRRFFCNGR